ncbi:iron(III) transport system substrate-binding protein [Paenibacillus cellulosilyticus]|uniref:Iron(III) transport system substrate-binding protein n=1 Tax=Paenibacillus cellulosilyticus TaxID=375489 RepID=A0A2V2YQ73_9BACL|nr:extracellular solute-binding protein [Paenibacillus cellulosilyticus]PWV98661.1 iron(III) transport system substrate-binding protein [Paenibacillus cellulosilyticus]
MYHKKKSLLAMIMLICAITLMTACGTTSKDEPASKETNASADTAAPAADNAGNGSDASAAASTETVEELYAQAKEGGKLIVYSTSGRANDAAETFMKQYPGIEVEVSKVKSDEMMDKVTKEQDAGQFNPDVILTKEVSGAVYEEMVKQGRYIKYLPEEFAPMVDEPYRTQAEAYANYVEFRTIFYNASTYSQAPVTNWWDLTTPEFKGKVYTADPLSSPAFMDLFTTMVINSDDMAAAYKAKFGKDIELNGTENAGYAFIKQLFDNGLIVLKGSDDVLDAIGKAKSDAVGLAVSGDVSKNEENGWTIAPILDIQPKTSVPDSGYLFIANKAPHEAAAKLFIRWMMGEKDGTGAGMEPFNKLGSWVPRSDVKTQNDVAFEELNLWLFDGEKLYNTAPQVRDFWIKHNS